MEFLKAVYGQEKHVLIQDISVGKTTVMFFSQGLISHSFHILYTCIPLYKRYSLPCAKHVDMFQINQLIRNVRNLLVIVSDCRDGRHASRYEEPSVSVTLLVNVQYMLERDIR